MTKDKCLKCGECCHYLDDNNIRQKCPQLIPYGNQKLCRLYPNHEGYEIAKLQKGVVVCCPRSSSTELFKGCPYNFDYVTKTDAYLKHVGALPADDEKVDIQTVRIKKSVQA